MRIHKVPNKKELENFIRKNDLPVDGIYDKDSAIRHFRNTSKQYKAERDTCLEDIEKLRKTLIKTQNLADELMEYQVKYINLTNHIRMKAENNPGVSRYIDLVNYIDRLERADDER